MKKHARVERFRRHSPVMPEKEGIRRVCTALEGSCLRGSDKTGLGSMQSLDPGHGRYRSLPLVFLGLLLCFPPVGYGASREATVGGPGQVGSPETGVAPIQPVQPAPESLQEEIPDWKARWELARLLSYVKRYEESLVEYGRVLEEKPDLWEAKVETAQVLYWSGRQSEASRTLEEIPAGHLDERARLLMADLYVARKAYDKAEPIFRAHLKSHPEDYRAAVKLADVLSWTRRYEEAILLYKEVLNARPDDIQIRRKYAYVLIWAGRPSEAAAELRKTLKP